MSNRVGNKALLISNKVLLPAACICLANHLTFILADSVLCYFEPSTVCNILEDAMKPLPICQSISSVIMKINRPFLLLA